MKKFMIRIVNVCMIVAALFGYNHVTLAHEKIDAEAKAEADRQSAELAAEAGVNGGNYTGKRRCFSTSACFPKCV